MKGLAAFLAFLFVFSMARATDFNPLHPDYELLNNLVINLLNSKREAKGKGPLVRNESLQKTAIFYTDKYVLRKFENSWENKLRISKKIKKLCAENGYTCRLIDFSINTASAIHYFGNHYYYDKEENASDLHLYFGKKKPSKAEKESSDYKPVPLKPYTYEELAEEIVKQFVHDKGHFKSLNNAYDQIGISCVVEPRSVGGRKRPQIKAIIIVGGKLINW